MGHFFYILIEAVCLSLALSADALASGVSYGAAKIKIPFLSCVIIGGSCAAVLAFAMFLGDLSQNFIPQNIAKYISCFILTTLGLVKLANLEAVDLITDTDNNKRLSWSESLVLSGGLSLDGLAAGFSWGIKGALSFLAVPLSFLFTVTAIFVGSAGAHKLYKNKTARVRYFGLILVALGLLKLF